MSQKIRYTLFILLTLILLAGYIRFHIITTAPSVVHDDGIEFFEFSGRIYQDFQDKDYKGVFNQNIPGHWGGILAGAAAYMVKWDGMSQRRISTLFFAFPQVINLLLLFQIARKLNLGEQAAIISVFLYAFNLVVIYRLRYAVPTSLAMTFFLLAILTVLMLNQRMIIMALVTGALAFLCFFTYNGYWIIAGLSMLFAAIYMTSRYSEFLVRSVLVLCGFVVPAMLFYLVAHHYGVDMLQRHLSFANTIHWGGFEDGFMTPIAFLIDVDPVMAVIWGGGVIYGLIMFRNYQIRLIIFGTMISYFIMGFFSEVLEIFAVYGRLVRQILPMLCLLSAVMLARFDFSRLFPIFVVIAVHFSMKASEMTEAWYERDFDRRFNEVRTGLGLSEEKGEIMRVLICEPHQPDESACQRIPQHCTSLFSYLYPYSHPYMRYDVGLTSEQRKRFSGVKAYIHAVQCKP